MLISALGSGLTPPALALWDVDGDSVEDVLLAVTESTNETRTTQKSRSKWFLNISDW